MNNKQSNIHKKNTQSSDKDKNVPIYTSDKQNEEHEESLKHNNNVATTGHEWDGITEYNNPEPSWLRYLFYLMVIASLIYWILYPSWPVPGSIGILDWSSDKELMQDQQNISEANAKYLKLLETASFDDINKNQALKEFATAGGESAFKDNCEPCHGYKGSGNRGYPNLQAGVWLWGGDLDALSETIKYGIRSEDANTRDSQMAGFGKDKILNAQEIKELTEYVLYFLWKKDIKKQDFSNASNLFKAYCSSCHEQNGTGSQEQGAPDLTDNIWLYGSDYNTIYDVIYNGREGMMPAWHEKFPETVIKQLAVYVNQLHIPHKDQ